MHVVGPFELSDIITYVLQQNVFQIFIAHIIFAHCSLWVSTVDCGYLPIMKRIVPSCRLLCCVIETLDGMPHVTACIVL